VKFRPPILTRFEIVKKWVSTTLDAPRPASTQLVTAGENNPSTMLVKLAASLALTLKPCEVSVLLGEP
jgi:hypothetical protein